MKKTPKASLSHRAMFKDVVVASATDECPEEASWRIAEAHRADQMKVLTLLLCIKSKIKKTEPLKGE